MTASQARISPKTEIATDLTGNVHTIKTIISGATINAALVGGYPTGAVPLVSASDNKAAAAGAATLSNGADGTTVYITGFEVTGAGATAASVVLVTVTGILGGTLTYVLAIPAGATVGLTPLMVEFAVPLPANAADVDIVVNIPSFGSGNTNAAVVAHGYRF